MMRLLYRAAIFAGTLAWVIGAPLAGQGPRLTPPLGSELLEWKALSAPPTGPVTALMDSAQSKRTYWVEGGVLGAVGGLVIANALNGFACQDSSGGCGSGRSVLFGLLGGFVVGSLIGGGITKDP